MRIADIEETLSGRWPVAGQPECCVASPGKLSRRAGGPLAALANPGQGPARAFAALGVHRPLKIADVGADGDA